MSMMTLFESSDHKNVLLEDQDPGEGVQANHHVIVHNGAGIVLDPGGHKVYRKVMSDTTSVLKGGKLKYVFLSHQDPDIVAALNGWLMTTDAVAYSSKLWVRFIPHFGLDKLVTSRLIGIEDEGCRLDLNGAELWVLPAHYLHSCGNFSLYDTTSKILYSGDIGASLGIGYREVTDFDAHIPSMAGFHRRYMQSNRALRAWVKMVRGLGVQTIAPQHGALFRGPEMSEKFLSWLETLECGIDVMEGIYKAPPP